MRYLGRARDVRGSALHPRVPPGLGGPRGHRGRDDGGRQDPPLWQTVSSDLELVKERARMTSTAYFPPRSVNFLLTDRDRVVFQF